MTAERAATRGNQTAGKAGPPVLIRVAAWLAGPDNAQLHHEWLDHLENLDISRYGKSALSDELGFVWTGLVVRLRSLADRHGLVISQIASDAWRGVAVVLGSFAAGFVLNAATDLAAGKFAAFAVWSVIGAALYWGETRYGQLPWVFLLWLDGKMELSVGGCLAFWTGAFLVLPISKSTAIRAVMWGGSAVSAVYIVSFAVWTVTRAYRARQARYLGAAAGTSTEPDKTTGS